MNRDFVLAATFAVTSHAALFFGFPDSAPRLSLKPITSHVIEICDFKLPPEPPDPAEVVIVPEGDASKQPPEPPPPRLVDVPVTPKPTDIVTRFVPVPDVEVDRSGPVFRIPTNTGPVGPRPGGVVPVAWLDAVPRARVQPSPTYPPEARREGLRGEVLVEFTVDETGHVLDPRVVRSTSPLFDSAALRGVLKWRFAPGRRDGQVVRFRMLVPVVFNLEE